MAVAARRDGRQHPPPPPPYQSLLACAIVDRGLWRFFLFGTLLSSAAALQGGRGGMRGGGWARREPAHTVVPPGRLLCLSHPPPAHLSAQTLPQGVCARRYRSRCGIGYRLVGDGGRAVVCYPCVLLCVLYFSFAKSDQRKVRSSPPLWPSPPPPLLLCGLSRGCITVSDGFITIGTMMGTPPPSFPPPASRRRGGRAAQTAYRVRLPAAWRCSGRAAVPRARARHRHHRHRPPTPPAHHPTLVVAGNPAFC